MAVAKTPPKKPAATSAGSCVVAIVTIWTWGDGVGDALSTAHCWYTVQPCTGKSAWRRGGGGRRGALRDGTGCIAQAQLRLWLLSVANAYLAALARPTRPATAVVTALAAAAVGRATHAVVGHARLA